MGVPVYSVKESLARFKRLEAALPQTQKEESLRNTLHTFKSLSNDDLASIYDDILGNREQARSKAGRRQLDAIQRIMGKRGVSEESKLTSSSPTEELRA